MKYSEHQYKTLAERFNKMSFLQKLITIKNNSEVFYLESDGYNFRLRLCDETAMNSGLDSYFSFPELLEYSHIKDILSLGNINVKKL